MRYVHKTSKPLQNFTWPRTPFETKLSCGGNEYFVKAIKDGVEIPTVVVFGAISDSGVEYVGEHLRLVSDLEEIDDIKKKEVKRVLDDILEQETVKVIFR